jgi:hypothetical protein
MMPPAVAGTPFTIAAVALLGWAFARIAWGYGARDPRYPRLSAREQAFLRAASDAVFPSGGPIPLSGPEAGALAHVDRFLAGIAPRSRVLVRLLFFLIEHATLVFPAPGWDGIRRFSKLSLAQRQAVLDGWGRSRSAARRTVFQSLRAILTMAYFASPAVLRAIGLAPLAMETPVVDADLLYPPIGQPKSAIRFAPADRERPVSRAPLDPHGPIDPAWAEAR